MKKNNYLINKYYSFYVCAVMDSGARLLVLAGNEYRLDALEVLADFLEWLPAVKFRVYTRRYLKHADAVKTLAVGDLKQYFTIN